MLSAHELDALCDRLGLSTEARKIIETVRSSPPARRVRSAAGNVAVRYASRKMGVTIQAESHRVELAELHEYEHDRRVLEFYDQPPAAATKKAAADIRLGRPAMQHTGIDPVAIRHALESVLATNELPQPSIRLVADRLGQTYANLHHYFPELCRAIASRHRSFQEAQGARTRTRLRERVSDAAIALTHRGLYPSASHIADLLGDRNVMRSRTARVAWREVLSELGWQDERAAGVADDLLTVLATSRQGAAKFQTNTSSADQ